MEYDGNLMNPGLTFKIQSEIIKENGMPIALINEEGRWIKCELFKINGLNPTVKTKLEGDYYLWLMVIQKAGGGGKRKKSKRRKSKKRRSKRRS